MALDIKTTRVLIRATTGTQDITIPNFGTPKCAIFHYNTSSVNNTVTASYDHSIGFTDGFKQTCVSASSQGGVIAANINTDRANRNDRLGFAVQNQAQFSFDSWITDGVRINVTSAPVSSGFIVVTFFGGDDLINASADAIRLQSLNHNVDLGFEPSLVIGVGTGMPIVGFFTKSLISTSFCVNDGQAKTASTSSFDFDAGTVTNSGTHRSDSIFAGTFINGSFSWSVSINKFFSYGYEITATNLPENYYVMCLSLKISDRYKAKLIEQDSPTGIGGYQFGELDQSFDPEFSWIVPNLNTAIGSSVDSQNITHSLIDSSNQYTVSSSSLDNQATTSVNNINYADGLTVLNGATKEYESTFVNFNSGRVVFGFTQAPATSYKWFGLIIGKKDVDQQNTTEILGDSLFKVLSEVLGEDS